MPQATVLDGSAAGAVPRGARRNAAIGLITLSLFTGTAARYALSPMQELVSADLGLGNHQIALLQGMALALPILLISIPLGRLVDRTNRARLMIVLALACTAGSVLCALAQNFATAFVARMLVAGSVVAAQPAALSLVADLCEPSRRGRMITLTSLGQVAGSTVAYILAGMLLPWIPTALPAGSALAALAPWRVVLLMFAAVVLATAIAMLWMREPQRREAGADSGGELRVALRALWAYRRFLLPLIGGLVAVGMADAAAAIWAVPVLTRHFHQTPADFGVWMGLLNLGSGVVGAVLGGFSADLGLRRKGRAGVLLGAVVATALSVPTALFPLMPDVAWFGVALALLLTCGGCANIAATSAIMVVLPNELRGICVSLVIAAGGMAAYGVAPLLVSVAAQLFGGGKDILIPLSCVGLLTSIAASAAFVRAMRVAGEVNPRETK
ncbi:MFS transporter [Massilia sp. SM-13]|uniref:MFS transporter n=1 Tax=Pseudoduganella rhizocola TaxID=3382643 RepID=UPI0038B52BAE